jgi:16S rRNA (uracil1498-N3)-methyltransferase
MHRFYLPPEQCRGAVLRLADREAHHAAQVDRRSVELAVREKRALPAPPFRITLLQAVPRGKIFEAIIQKATELGVSRIVPLLASRVTTRLDDESAAAKADKWRQVAVEAIKQCGSPWLPEIEPPLAPAEFLARQESFELPLIASLQPGSRHAREYSHAFQQEHGRPPQSACVWVGPEGDFTPEEVASVVAGGARPITLGRLVLRVETAAVYCLSILNHELHGP